MQKGKKKTKEKEERENARSLCASISWLLLMGFSFLSLFL